MIEKGPLVTIVTPSYNQGQFVEETIKSVLNQAYPNIEYIFVDGGSTDQTMKIIERYRDKIDVIIHEKDKGQADAINKGFKLAKGELVGWINSDDILYPDCVEKIVELYKENPNGVIFYGSMNTVISKNGSIRNTYITIIRNRKQLLNKSYNIIQPGSFYRSKIVKSIGYVNENIKYGMDLDLWLRLLIFGDICRIDNYQLAAIRDWEHTKTTTGGIKFLKEIRQILFKNGASILSPNIRKTYWYQVKCFLKHLVR